MRKIFLNIKNLNNYICIS